MKLLSWKSVNREAMSPLLTRQHLSCEKMTLARVELKKGCYVPSHQHENEQISHVLEGALKFVSEGKEYVVRSEERRVGKECRGWRWVWQGEEKREKEE